MRRRRARAPRANPTRGATLIVERRRLGSVWLRVRRAHPVERDEAVLVVSGQGPYFGARWVSVTVWPWADTAVIIEGELDARGDVRWTGARRAADRLALPLEPALERFGATIDALLALYFQELPAAEYTIEEFP